MWFSKKKLTKKKKLTYVSGIVDRVGTSRDKGNDYPILVLRLTGDSEIYYVITKHCHAFALTAPGDEISLTLDSDVVYLFANKTLGVEGMSCY